MKKYILFLFLGLPLFMVGQIQSQYSFSEESLQLENRDGYTVISCPAMIYSGEVGKPQIPYVEKTYLLPHNAKIMNVRIEQSNSRLFTCNNLIYPVQPPRSIEGEEPEFVFPDSTVYHSGELFPSERYSVLSEEFLYGYHIVRLNLYPVQYHPLLSKLYLNDIEVNIEYRIDAQTSEVMPVDTTTMNGLLAKRFVYSAIENKTDMNRFYAAPAGPAPRVSSTRIEVPDTDRAAPALIIITNKQLESSFKRLAEWRSSTGSYACIKLLEEIERGYQGADAPERIRNYLKEVYSRWGTSVFILIGGDINCVPSRYCKSWNDNTTFPTDIYYANANGSSDWNSGKGMFFTTPGSAIRNFVLGRIPVDTPEKADTFVSKIISYEKAEGVRGNASRYYRNVLVAAAKLSVTDREGDRDMDSLSNLYNYCLRKYADCKYLLDGRSFENISSDLSKSSFLASLESSDFPPHIVLHMDHSGPQSMGTCEKTKSQVISNPDVDALRNGKYYQILISGGCHPANFGANCIAERFLNNSDGGAVAFLGNSDYGIWGDGNRLAAIMKNLYEQTAPSFLLGDSYHAMYKGINQIHNFRYGHNDYSYDSRFHLLGDPRMPVWTDEAKETDIIVSEKKQEDGTYLVTIHQTMPNTIASVSFWKEGELFFNRALGPGSFEFLLTPKTSGYIKLTVTAHNRIPYERHIIVESANLNTLHLDTVYINDVYAIETKGNGDGKLDAGETVFLNVALKNTGAVQIPQLTGQVSCNNENITLLSNDISWGTIPTGGVATVRIKLQAGKDMKELLQSDPESVKLNFVLTDSNGKTYSLKKVGLDVFHSDLQVGKREILSTSNGNLTLEPGDTVKMNVCIANYGPGKSSFLTVLFGGDFISNSIASYSEIEGYGEKVNTAPFSFRISPTYQTGTPLIARFTILNGFGKQWTGMLDLTEKCDTIDFAKLRYVSDESTIQMHWNPVNRSKGYNVYRSETDDSGNDLNQYKKINLFPFSFAYFTDTGVEESKRYYYKVSVVSETGAEEALSRKILASTSLRPLRPFPVQMLDTEDFRIDNSAFAVDVNNDGYAEVFTGARLSDGTNKSKLIAVDRNGNDLFDLDNNPATHTGFAEMPYEFNAHPSICTLTPDGEPLLFFANRGQGNGSSLFCYSFKDENRDGKPNLRWEKRIADGSFTSSVIAEDLDGDGTKELILRSSVGKIYVYSVKNDNLYSFGPGNVYNDVAVADLDGDGKKEIVAGFEKGGVCVFKHDGTPFSTNPVFTKSGYGFQSTPVICDLDNDGIKEILIMGRRSSATTVFAIKPDGTPVEGWDGTQTSQYKMDGEYRNMYQNFSVGDLDNDGNLEVVVPGINEIVVWRNNGTLISRIPLNGLFKQNSPILADVDEDRTIEIIVPVEERIYAFHMDGSNVAGFPVIMEDHIRQSPCVADIDNDGKNELVAFSRRKMYVWKTAGDADKVEWGMERHNLQNTGEYSSCSSKTIRANMTWNHPYNLCGDLIVNSGTLTIGAGCRLQMSGKAKITVKRGATLKIDAGRIENADIKVSGGGKLEILNKGHIIMGRKGFLTVEKGATMNYQVGDVSLTR